MLIVFRILDPDRTFNAYPANRHHKLAMDEMALNSRW
jgi:hypothetical protein